MITRRQFLTGSLLSLPLAISALASTPQDAEAATKKLPAKNFDKFIGLPDYKLVLALNPSNTKIYKTASTKSRAVCRLRKKSCVIVDTSSMKKGQRYQWVKVKLQGKRHGYMKARSVNLVVLNTRDFGLDTSTKEGQLRASICRYGLKYIGTPWKYNGTSFSGSISCFTFCYRIFTKFGCKPNGNGLKKLGHSGKGVSRRKLKPGDLITYSSGPKEYAHVAIYLGNDLIINSSGHYGTSYPNGGIRISSLYYRHLRKRHFRNIVSTAL